MAQVLSCLTYIRLLANQFRNILCGECAMTPPEGVSHSASWRALFSMDNERPPFPTKQPCQAIPPYLRGWKFTPLIKGVGLKNHFKISGFGQPTPLIKGVNLPIPLINGVWVDRESLGDGKWGFTKYKRTPKCEGDRKGRVPKRPLSRQTLQNKGFGAPIFQRIFPKLSAALLGIHQVTCTFLHPCFPVATMNEKSSKTQRAQILKIFKIALRD